MRKILTIAIDGPVGSGKGTLGLALAKKLKALYFYTGGMYRALALACLRKKVDLRREEEVKEVLRDAKIFLKISSVGTNIFLGKENVNNELFLPEVTEAVPIVSAHPGVREEMVRRQKSLIGRQSLVIEGRDVATQIVPEAEVKIYLTADIKIRAKRRYSQLLKRGIKKSFEEVLEDTRKRDRLDTQRTASPLTIAPGAHVFDTTNDTVEETVEKVLKRLKEMGLI